MTDSDAEREVGERRDALDGRCREFLRSLGLANSGTPLRVTPLSGGVSSDIARVDLPDRVLCLKFALPKLKVSADWFAPVNRNRAEYAWLKVAGEVAPSNAVELIGRSEELNGFAMAFLEGADVFLWKDRLLAGAIARGEAGAVGEVLGRIHRASAKTGFDRSGFQNGKDFHALRTDPYLVHTAGVHPDVASILFDLAQRVDGADNVLVHGDVSPKNIVFRKASPILLDAECATMGDASFDPAFCINHLILKSIHRPAAAAAMLRGAREFWNAYVRRVNWEAPDELERKTVRLIPALMLARIDGKSPVEYLSEKARALTRGLALDLLRRPPSSLSSLASRIGIDKGAASP